MDEDERDEDTSAIEKVNAEEILFGASLGKHHVANIELDSDQESTDGEDSAPVSSLSQLTPDHLLYRSARVHNLPVYESSFGFGC